MATTNLARGPSTRGLGASDTSTLNSMFPRDPRHSLANYDVEATTKLLIDGVIQGNDYLAQGFNLDYDESPEITEFHIKHGTTGQAGNVNPNDLIPLPNYNPPSSGFGSTDSPHSSAAVISKQEPSSIKLGTHEV